MSLLKGTDLTTYLRGVESEAQLNAAPDGNQNVVQSMQSELNISEVGQEKIAEVGQQASLETFIPTQQGFDLV